METTARKFVCRARLRRRVLFNEPTFGAGKMVMYLACSRRPTTFGRFDAPVHRHNVQPYTVRLQVSALYRFRCCCKGILWQR